MTINKTKNNNVLTVALAGRLDTTTSPDLEKAIKDDLNDIKNLVFDFSGLEYISSAGLRVMLSSQKAISKQGTMVIRNANDDIKEIFDITGLTDVLTIE